MSRGRRSGRQRKADAERPSGWSETVRSLGYALVFFLILRTFVLQTFFITSGSMEDTLMVGDFLVVNRAAIGGRIPFTERHVPGYSAPKRGEVLVFDPPHTDEFRLVKRVVGMPGDRLEMRDQVLYVNDEAQDEPYTIHGPIPDEADLRMEWQLAILAPDVDPASYRATRDNWGPLVVPDKQYFMLGDNREMSYDSRYFGTIDGWRIEGKVSFIYFSYNRESYRPFAFVREVRWGRIFTRPR